MYNCQALPVTCHMSQIVCKTAPTAWGLLIKVHCYTLKTNSDILWTYLNWTICAHNKNLGPKDSNVLMKLGKHLIYWGLFS